MTRAALVVQLNPELEADRLQIGGKASSLVSLARAGARVPPAFVLTTHAHRRWLAGGGDALLEGLIAEGMAGLEGRSGCRFGAGLSVSVRSGAPVSMPGMMDTLLNVGLGSRGPGRAAYLYAARANFLRQFAERILGLGEEDLQAPRSASDPPADEASVREFERRVSALARAHGQRWPETPRQELTAAVAAVFASWHSDRARLYRRMHKIGDDLGTSVTIQQMVFGNCDHRSGSGVMFTRDPTTGERHACGEFLLGGQGEDVVAGRVTGVALQSLHDAQPDQFKALVSLGSRLESDSKRVQEIEFTIEKGVLYILQTRPALLTAQAGARVAVEMVQEGLIDRVEALDYARGHGFERHGVARLAVRAASSALLQGLAVGGGGGVGRVALGPATAEALLGAGDPVVFVANETSPDLLAVMRRSAALVTMRGGATSHAAVVAREVGIPCVVGIGAAIVGGRIAIGEGIADGEWVTVDGDSGNVFLGDVSEQARTCSGYEQTLRQWAGAGANA